MTPLDACRREHYAKTIQQTQLYASSLQYSPRPHAESSWSSQGFHRRVCFCLLTFAFCLSGSLKIPSPLAVDYFSASILSVAIQFFIFMTLHTCFVGADWPTQPLRAPFQTGIPHPLQALYPSCVRAESCSTLSLAQKHYNTAWETRERIVREIVVVENMLHFSEKKKILDINAPQNKGLMRRIQSRQK